ncbi:MAG TPA: tRNA pseudouridine(13) synthase TruD [Gemmataceae bacterium]
MWDDAFSPPLLTGDLPGIGGRIKQEPEDFQVEEVPAYAPCGQGDHLFLWVEKRDVGAEFFLRELARRLGVPQGEIGTAGMKDRRAVTRQAVSVPAAAEPHLGRIDGGGIRLLGVSRHTNKLRPGHLRGNRFRVLVRDVAPEKAELLGRLLGELRGQGVPNYFGPQRFGRDGETARTGMDLLAGRGGKVRTPFLRKLALSAAQSVLFNLYLARRLRDGLFRRVLPGDVMNKWPQGGMFVARDVGEEQARFDRRETVHTGPMFGRKTFPAEGEAAEREASVLAGAGLSPESFTGFGKLLPGTRRMNLVYPDDVSASWDAAGVWLSFALPAGSYATVLLREVMKSDVGGDEVA